MKPGFKSPLSELVSHFTYTAVFSFAISCCGKTTSAQTIGPSFADKAHWKIDMIKGLSLGHTGNSYHHCQNMYWVGTYRVQGEMWY